VDSQSNYPQLPNVPLQLPEMKAPFNVASSIQSTIKLAKRLPSGQLMGQNKLESHRGTTGEPEALQLLCI